MKLDKFSLVFVACLLLGLGTWFNCAKMELKPSKVKALSATNFESEPEVLYPTDHRLGPITLPSAVIGTKRVLLVPYGGSDNSLFSLFNTQDLKNFFTNTVAAYYQQASYGALNFTVDVTPWISTPGYPASNRVCTKSELILRSGAVAYGSGYDFAQYDHIMFIVPQVGSCDTINGSGVSFAEIGGRYAFVRTGFNGAFDSFLMTHEFGHNLGLYHAHSYNCNYNNGRVCKIDGFAEYGNNYDVMGYGYRDDLGNSCFSQVHGAYRYMQGWLPTSSVITVTTSERTIDLQPLNSSTGTRLIRIPYFDEEYFVEYRTPTNGDECLGLQEPNGGIFVYKRTLEHQDALLLLRNEGSDRYGALRPGETFESERSAIRVQVSSQYPNRVNISMPEISTRPCVPNDTTLCLQNNQAEVKLFWNNQHSPGQSGFARTISASNISGYFWFFDPSNIEAIVKVLRDTSHNSLWVYFGGLTDIEYWLKVRETTTGRTNTYYNPPGFLCGNRDTQAFLLNSTATHQFMTASSSASTASVQGESQSVSCPSDSTQTLYLLNNRFKACVSFRNQYAGGVPGVGKAVPFTNLSGRFWFFSQDNIELVLKVIDGRALNNKFWIYYGSLTDVEFDLNIIDTETGHSKVYHNAPGHYCGVADTSF